MPLMPVIDAEHANAVGSSLEDGYPLAIAIRDGSSISDLARLSGRSDQNLSRRSNIRGSFSGCKTRKELLSKLMCWHDQTAEVNE